MLPDIHSRPGSFFWILFSTSSPFIINVYSYLTYISCYTFLSYPLKLTRIIQTAFPMLPYYQKATPNKKSGGV